MSREDEQAAASSSMGASHRLSGGRWGLGVAGLLLAYPLSLAPVAFVYARCGSPPPMEEALVQFYKPLSWVGEKVPAAASLLARWELLGYRMGGGKVGFSCGTR